jgi:hypothetical protein
MPGFDGTGPSGGGPLTGRGEGYCVLKIDSENPVKSKGNIGLQGKSYTGEVNNILSGSDINLYYYFNQGGNIMPRGDRTGPMGLGPMTGRAAGFCTGYTVPGYMNPIPGRGLGFFGRGRGRGRGFRNMYFATGLPAWARYNMGAYYPDNAYAPPAMTASQEAEALKQQAKLMQDNINALNERIQELERLEADKAKTKK